MLDDFLKGQLSILGILYHRHTLIDKLQKLHKTINNNNNNKKDRWIFFHPYELINSYAYKKYKKEKDIIKNILSLNSIIIYIDAYLYFLLEIQNNHAIIGIMFKKLL